MYWLSTYSSHCLTIALSSQASSWGWFFFVLVQKAVMYLFSHSLFLAPFNKVIIHISSTSGGYVCFWGRAAKYSQANDLFSRGIFNLIWYFFSIHSSLFQICATSVLPSWARTSNGSPASCTKLRICSCLSLLALFL